MNKSAPSAFGTMAALVTGATPHSPATYAAELLEVAGLLREHDSPAARRHARALERWVDEGGDLKKMLGLTAPRGAVKKTPQRVARLAKRDALLCSLANSLAGTTHAKATTLAAMARADDSRVLVLRELGMPSSERQIVRILRSSTVAE